MNGFLMSFGGYISQSRCCVGVVDLVADKVFLKALGMAMKFTIYGLKNQSNRPRSPG